MKTRRTAAWLMPTIMFFAFHLPTVAGPNGSQGQTKQTVCEYSPSPTSTSMDQIGILYEVVTDASGKVLSKTSVGFCKGNPWALTVPSRPVAGMAGRIEWAPLSGLRPISSKQLEQIRKTGRVPSGITVIDRGEMERRLQAAEKKLKAQ